MNIMQIRLWGRFNDEQPFSLPETDMKYLVQESCSGDFGIIFLTNWGNSGISRLENLTKDRGEKILWSRKWQPTPVFLPGESHGQRSLAGYSSKESDSTERLTHTHTHTHTHTQNSIVALLDFDRNSNTLSVQRNVHFSDNLWQLESCLLGIDVGFLSWSLSLSASLSLFHSI